MAYYGALVSLVQLLEDIVHRDLYQDLLLDKKQIASVYEKFSRLQALLDDDSSKDGEEVGFSERLARDAAYQAQDIIESHISNQFHLKTHGQFQLQRSEELILDNVNKDYQELEKVKKQVDSIVEELLRIKKNRATEDLQLNYYSADAGTSKQAPTRTDTMEGVEERLTMKKDQCPNLHVHKLDLSNLILGQPISLFGGYFSPLKSSVDYYIAEKRKEADFLKKIGKKRQELETVKEQVDSIVKELLRIKKSPTTKDLQLNYCSTDAGTSKQVRGRTDTMEGVEECLNMIKGQLCGESSKLQVVSIMGMGGIGKTTLARNIFDDELIVYRFHFRAWVTISQEYHLEKVLLNILHSLKVSIDKSNEVGELQEKIYKHLKGRRYLIIVDDIWETKTWDDIKRIFPDDSNGSRIVITTRISDVASYAGSFGFSHHMQTLSEDQSWNLFCKKVSCPPELEDIGRLIAKNCGGLPLAIVVAAGFISKVDKKRFDWEEIGRNLSSTVENNEQFSKIIFLSYNNLPHHLKPLFLYIGGFPGDYEIPVSRLVKLWIAEGFLKPVESKSLEEVAQECLEDLVKRNLVLTIKRTFTGKIKYCGIHDILRELCTKIVCNEDFLHVLRKDSCIYPTDARNVRRIYIHLARSTFAKAKEFSSHVRSIIHLGHEQSFLSFSFYFGRLRVLDAIEISLLKFPPEILELFHLRYLALSDGALPIPPSIFKLQNLQTLILVSSNRYGISFSLPSEIRMMPNLRHIMVCALELSSLPKKRIAGVSYILENLQTLSWVVNVRFTDRVIEMIPNLQKLKVLYHEPTGVWQKFQLNNLFHLPQLKTLNIFFPHWYSNVMNPFPESFAFPLMLRKLSLKGCRIPWEDMTVVGSLPNLQALKLRDNAFVGKKWESIEGEFPQLRFLLMEDLGVKYWHAEDTHFPRLQHLKIISCWKLQEIPQEIGNIPTLELLEVKSSHLAANSAKQMQEEQRDLGNDDLQVRVYR